MVWKQNAIAHRCIIPHTYERKGKRDDLSRQGDDHFTLQAIKLVLALIEEPKAPLVLAGVYLDREAVDDAGDEVGHQAVVIVEGEATFPGDVVDAGGDDLRDWDGVLLKGGVGHCATNLRANQCFEPCHGGHEVQKHEERVEVVLAGPVLLPRVTEDRQGSLGVLPDLVDDCLWEACVGVDIGDGEGRPGIGGR